MPSPVPTKCRGPIVRQLSLQNQTPLQPTSIHILKKQLSEDDTRSFDAVEITGQKWTAVDRPESILRVSSAETKIVQGGKFSNRPKPLKIAWADIKQNSTGCSTGVEIVATKCPGQPRPLSIKTQRFKKPLLGNKDTLVYTRLQLAERLRNAWSEREKVKPNLNIFLAQPSDTPRSDNNLQSARQQDNLSTLSDPSVPSVPDKKRKAIQSKGQNEFLQPHCLPEEILQSKLHVSLYKPKLQLEYFHKEKDEIAKKVESSSICEKNSTEETTFLQELKKVEIKIIKNENIYVKDSSKQSSNGDKSTNQTYENCSEVCQGKIVEKKAQQPAITSAQERRANFRRSGILHKTLTESFSSQITPQYEDKGESEHADAVKKSFPKKPPLIRNLSAPNQEQSLQKPKVVKPQFPRRLQPTYSFDNFSLPLENMTEMKERIKSAPIRRKLKTAAVRRKNKDKTNSSSEDEKESKEPLKTAKKTITKKTYASKGAEIITMVSLVSPAESDTEDSVINLPIESYSVQEQKDEKSQSNSFKDSEQKDSSSFDVQKFVSLRKTTKTVSFQSNPVLSRSYCASFPSRRAPAGTPIIVPTPVNNNPALTPAQLQEKDKRPPIFSGSDGRGIKRRLLRSTSEPAKEEDEVCENQKFFDVLQGFKEKNENSIKSSGDSNEEKDEEKDDKSCTLKQLEFKYPREKECWNLYQKMVAKGVSVSYDTILRGMLTPTEYRLRKNYMLPTC